MEHVKIEYENLFIYFWGFYFSVIVYIINHSLDFDASRILLFQLVWLRTVGDATKMRMMKRFTHYSLSL
jgi:hypothetical protein